MTEQPDLAGDILAAEREKVYARSPTINLNPVVAGLPVRDQIALADAKIRRTVAYSIMTVFIAINILTLYFLDQLFRTDQFDLEGKIIAPAGRIVTSNVVMTLLGATTVQLGTVMVIMARYVFPAAKVDQA